MTRLNNAQEAGAPDEAVHSEIAAPLLSVKNLDVSYGPTRALDGANLRLMRGEVHALIGENGCGKSTLVKAISGIVRPGGGIIEWRGQQADFRRPRAAQDNGILTVFQETMVADEMSVLDNLCLGIDRTFRKGMPNSKGAIRAREVLDLLGLEQVSLDTPLWQLTLSRRHLVAIGRALMRPWSLLILDEATASLDVEERERLFSVIRDSTRRGSAVLYISHRLAEIEELAAKVTVMRAGKTVGLLDREELTRAAVLDLMSPPTALARERAELKTRGPVGADSEQVVLSASRVTLATGAQPIDLDIRQGEIVGLAGLEGHGQVAFLRTLAGWDSPVGGEVSTSGRDGQPVTVRSAVQALKYGIAYLPGDRKTEGIFAPLSVRDNLTIANLRKYVRWGLLSPSLERKSADAMVRSLRVKTASLDVPIESLSGGNQQKVVLGRWLSTNPRLILLEDPMRGVDVTSKAEIISVLADLVAVHGVTLVLLSTEVEELVDFCQRVVVFREQSVAAVLDRSELDEQAVVSAMLGGDSSERA